MKKAGSLLATAALAVFFVSCDKGPFPDYEKTKTGIFYRFVTKSETESKPKVSDFVVVNMRLTNQADTVLFDSKKVPNSPEGGIMFPLMEKRMIGNLEEGLSMMNKGDSASFIVLADSVYHGAQLPKNVATGSYIKFYVKLLNFRSKDDVMAEQQKITAERQQMLEKSKNEETASREKYLADNHISVKPSQTGLYYIEKKKGTGDLVKLGQTASMLYTGKLLNGEIFDASANHGNQPYAFPVGGGQVIAAWDEAALLMRKGGKATIIVPSSIAYGDQGTGPIPPYASLVFDIELVDIK